jgi:hypothetical protein
MIPDYRRDTGAEAFERVAPRVVVTLLGLLVASLGWSLAQPTAQVWNLTVVGSVLAFLGIEGFWLPFVRPLQYLAAAWLAVSCFVFGVHGAALWSTLAVATALLVITVISGWGRVTSP